MIGQTDKHTTVISLHIRAMSPLSHYGDERAGNTQLCRRMAIMTDDGRREIPIVTGNSLRGQLRRIAATDLLDRLDLERVPLPVYHLLFAGGSLVAGAIDHAHRILRIADMRALIPQLGLFGGALKTEIVPGSLRVDMLMPICSETSGLTGVESNVSVDDLIDNVFYTRRDDSAASGCAEESLTTEAAQQMIYDGDVLVAGTQLIGAVRTTRATDVELGCLSVALSEWMSDPRLGGNLSRGHGMVDVELADELPPVDAYTAHVEACKAEIESALIDGGEW